MADSDVSVRTVEGTDDSGRFVGVVETALAAALERASVAGQWELVGQLAAELEARRTRREGESRPTEGAPVVTLDDAKRRAQR